MKSNFYLGDISENFHQVINKTKLILNDNIVFLKSFNDNLKEIEKNNVLTVSFIGQYSSGKSSIISALTGNKSIKIDADIATANTTLYEWNNIMLIDTPGLYTDRLEHDQITNDKIKESDLLIFCLTSDLFDDIVLDNFVKLAFDNGYKNKMMLVINKMSMESGEYGELVNNYKISLRKSLIPYKLDEFIISFIDTADYIEGKDENDESLLELSHFDDFIFNLNNFINSRGIMGQLDTPIRLAMTNIDNFIIESTSKDQKELFQTLERIEYSINKNKERTEIFFNLKVNELTLLILKKSNEITGKIGDEKFDSDAESKAINIYIEKEIEKVRNDIQVIIEEQNKLMEEQISNIIKSEMYKFVFVSVETGKIKLSDSTKKDLFNIKNKIDKGKIEASFKAGVDGIEKFAKPSIIKDVGHFFGAKFKPWQAVNLTKTVGKALNFLGPALSAFFLYMDIKDLVEQEKNAKIIADSKQKCHNEFLEIASQIENKFKENFVDFKKKSYLKILEEIRIIRKNILSERELNDKMSKELLLQKNKLEKLLIEIYK